VVIEDEADLETGEHRRSVRARGDEAGAEGGEVEPVEPIEPIGATLRDDGPPRRRWRLFRKGGEE
jgi:hypothetical protein